MLPQRITSNMHFCNIKQNHYIRCAHSHYMLCVGRGRKSTKSRNSAAAAEAAVRSTVRSTVARKQQLQQAYGQPAQLTVGRSSRTVDRPGRPSCTDVHRRCISVDCPVDRLKVPNSRLGTVNRPGRPVHRVGRPAVGSDCFGKVLN